MGFCFTLFTILWASFFAKSNGQTPGQVTSASVSQDSALTGATLTFTPAATGTTPTHFEIEALPIDLYENFTSGTFGPNWVREPGTSPLVEVSNPKPNWMRISLPPRTLFDIWVNRGTAPVFYYDAEMRGSYFFSVQSDITASFINTDLKFRLNSMLGGVCIWDLHTSTVRAIYGSFMYTPSGSRGLEQRLDMNNYAEVSPAHPTFWLFYNRVFIMSHAILYEYNPKAIGGPVARYTLLFKFPFSGDQWTTHSVALERHLYPLHVGGDGKGGPSRRPRLALCSKTWSTENYWIHSDYTDVVIRNVDPTAVRVRHIVRHTGAGTYTVNVPINMYITYQFRVVAKNGNIASPPRLSNWFVRTTVTPQDYSSAPTFVLSRLDGSQSSIPNVAVSNWNAPENLGIHRFGGNYYQGTSNEARPYIRSNALFDRGAFSCFYDRGSWSMMEQSPGSPNEYAFVNNNYPFTYYSMFIVIRSDVQDKFSAPFAYTAALHTESGNMFTVRPNNAGVQYRFRETNGAGAGESFSAPLDPQLVYLLHGQILRNDPSAGGRGTVRFFVNGKHDGMLSTGYGFSQPHFPANAAQSTSNWPKMCRDENPSVSGSNGFVGDIFEFIFRKGTFTNESDHILASEMISKYYIECPAVKSSLASLYLRTNTSEDVIPAPSSSFSMPDSVSCDTATNGNLCMQGCPAGTSLVHGFGTAQCRNGQWSGGLSACGATCPALPRPPTASSCRRIVQWEPFMADLNVSSPQLLRRRTYTGEGGLGSSPASLQHWTLFPPAPDVAVQSLFSVVPPSAVETARTTSPFQAIPLGVRQLLQLDTDLVAAEPGEQPYSSMQVLRDGELARKHNVSLHSGFIDPTLTSQNVTASNEAALRHGGTPTASGTLSANINMFSAISPYDSGYGLVQYNLAWARDSVNFPSSLTFTYSMRMRISLGRAGLLFRCSTSAPYRTQGMLESTGCLLVTVDIEAMDEANDPITTPVLRLFQQINGVQTLLVTVYKRSIIVPLRRGRWFTLEVASSGSQTIVSIADDLTGASQVALSAGGSALPPGGGGPFIDGMALFDDYVLSVPCSVSGHCTGISSGYSHGVGGACMHSCPAGYHSTGDSLRTCGPDGQWSGQPLQCSPDPPLWQMQQNPGDGGAVIIGGEVTFLRAVDERSPTNTLVGVPISAISQMADSSLPLFYRILEGNTIVPEDATNSSLDPDVEPFSIGLCDGQIRVKEPQIVFKDKSTYTLRISVTATGDLGAESTAFATVSISVANINDAPRLVGPFSLSVSELAAEGTVLGIIEFEDPDVDTPLYREPVLEILNGNELGLFVLGPNAPLVPLSAAKGTLSLGTGVNVGSRPGSALCSCGSRVLNFESQRQFTLQVRIIDGLDSSLFEISSITVQVLDANDQPQLLPASFQLPEADLNVSDAVVGVLRPTDEDSLSSGQTISVELLRAWGGAGQAPPAISLIPTPTTSQEFPLQLGADGVLSVHPDRTRTFNELDALKVYAGLATRAVFVLEVRVTDSHTPSLSDTANVTVLVTAGATAGGVLGIVTDFFAPLLATNGSSIVSISCDFCNPQLPVTALYGPTATPEKYASTCSLFLPVAQATTGMLYNCTTAEGFGSSHSWTFFQGTGPARLSLPSSGGASFLTSYAPPHITGVYLNFPYNNTFQLSQLPTVAVPADALTVRGTNFGASMASVGAVLSVTGEHPTQPGARVSYPVTVTSYTHDAIVMGLPSGGTSPALRFALQVGGAESVAQSQPGFALLTVAALQPALGVDLTALSGAGGEELCVRGAGFGPATHPGVDGAFSPRMFVGRAFSNGLDMQLENCYRPAPIAENLCCSTPRGLAGRDLIVRVGHGKLPQPLTLAQLNSSFTVSAAPPSISGVVGMTAISTAGGDAIRVRGRNLCSVASFSAGFCSVAVYYGPSSNIRRYTARDCAVVPGDSSAPEIACSAPPGTGRHFSVLVEVAGQLSSPFSQGVDRSDANAIGYAFPVYTSFGGAAVGANTAGGEAVLINGLNLGTNVSLIDVSFSLTLKKDLVPDSNATPDNSTAGDDDDVQVIQYRPASCQVTIPHIQLSCVLPPGVGAVLKWTLVVDSVASVQPSTSYAPPIITSLALYDSTNGGQLGLTQANPSGGSVLRILGSGFSPPTPHPLGAQPLLQTLYLVSPSGLETVVEPTRFTHISDGRIDFRLPPGTSSGWRVRVRVADRDSALPPADQAFGYRPPQIVRVEPQLVPAVGGRVTVFADNLGIADQMVQVYIVYGNAADASRHPSLIRASRVPREAADTQSNSSTPSQEDIYYMDRVSFAVPAGIGAGRSVGLLAVPGGEPLPAIGSAQPRSLACYNSPAGPTLGALATLAASACLHETVPDLISHTAPSISSIVVTQISSDADIALLTTLHGGFIEIGLFRRLDIYGLHFGPRNFGSAAAMLARYVQLESANSPGTWGEENRFTIPPFSANSPYWSDTHITVFTLVQEGRIRLAFRSSDASGSAISQLSNAVSYGDLSPIADLIGGAGLLPTRGGQVVNFTISNLASATAVAVTFGGREALICDPTVLPLCSATVAPSAFAQKIVNNPNSYSPSGPVTSDTIWTISVLSPPGHGTGKPLVLRRLPDGVATAPIALFDYAPPSLQTVAVSTDGGLTFGPANPTVQLSRLLLPTSGAVLRLTGTNFGPCPVLHAVHVLSTCDSLHPITGAVQQGQVNASAAGLLDLPQGVLLGVNEEHTELTMLVPGGEGDGTLLLGDSRGFTLFLMADTQASTDTGAQPLNFGWLPHSLVSAAVSNSSVPTSGGARLIINGANFGTAPPGFPYAAYPSNLQLSVTLGHSGTPALDWLQCLAPQRLSHSQISCVVPEGAGRDFLVRVTILGRAEQLPGPIFSYDAPIMTGLRHISPEGATLQRAALGLPVLLPTSSWDLERLLVIEGRNFGPRASTTDDEIGSCVLLSWSGAPLSSALCNGLEDFFGEGELHPTRILSWNHTAIIFTLPGGSGSPLVNVQAARQRSTASGFPYSGSLRFQSPSISALYPPIGTTVGGTLLRLEGANFGPSSFLGNTSYPRPLDLDAEVPYTALRVDWGPRSDASDPSLPNTAPLYPVGSCLVVPPAALQSAPGIVALAASWDCRVALEAQSHEFVEFRSPPGVGVDIAVGVTLVEFDSATPVFSSPALPLFSYAPPEITTFNPNPVFLTDLPSSILRVNGSNFGSTEILAQFPLVNASVAVAINDHWGVCSGAQRAARNGVELGVECNLRAAGITVGPKNVSISIASQLGRLPHSAPQALSVVCGAGFFAREGETCLPCPHGAVCIGFREERTLLGDVARVHHYPQPLRGFFNLNSSYPGNDGCPFSNVVRSPVYSADLELLEDVLGDPRDVCITPCDPPEACVGDNHCAEGYASVAPAYRCASCASGFFKRAGVCVKCPDSPAALFVGFAILILVIASAGFFLNRKQVNIAVLSIGIDYFQVLAIFSNTRIEWPDEIKELFHILSAFNLNLEIVAPECLIPDVSYREKFYSIMLLPICVGAIFFVIHAWLYLYKLLILRRNSAKRLSHTPALVSSLLVLVYILYLYLTRTIMDVFNCAPLEPPTYDASGKVQNFLQVIFEECGTPGGTQRVLLPFAISALIVYTIGYPVGLMYTIWRHRELIMEDQLLRAKGVGASRLQNPNAYALRKTLGRSYFQFKPDFFFWIFCIILRKLLIAITAVIFNRNSSFQMAACLLIMFLAYAAQVQLRPYMSPGDFEEVLRLVSEKSFYSPLHARLRSVIQGIETRGRKRTGRNLLFSGKFQASQAFGWLSSWLFNYNTVEAILLFSAVIVCLMGIMYQASDLNSAYQNSKSSVTVVLMFVIVLSIIYFFFVLVLEVVVMLREASHQKQINAGRKSKLQGKLGESSGGTSPGGNPMLSTRPTSSSFADTVLNTAVENQMNPLFLLKDGNSLVGSNETLMKSLAAQQDPPPPELWRVYKDQFLQMAGSIESMQSELITYKQKVEFAKSGASGTATVTETEPPKLSVPKKQFAAAQPVQGQSPVARKTLSSKKSMRLNK